LKTFKTSSTFPSLIILFDTNFIIWNSPFI
jgi:hypothetical protein